MNRARNLGVWTQRIAITAALALIVGFAVRVGSSSSQSLEFRDPLIWLASNGYLLGLWNSPSMRRKL